MVLCLKFHHLILDQAVKGFTCKKKKQNIVGRMMLVRVSCKEQPHSQATWSVDEASFSRPCGLWTRPLFTGHMVCGRGLYFQAMRSGNEAIDIMYNVAWEREYAL